MDLVDRLIAMLKFVSVNTQSSRLFQLSLSINDIIKRAVDTAHDSKQTCYILAVH